MTVLMDPDSHNKARGERVRAQLFAAFFCKHIVFVYMCGLCMCVCDCWDIGRLFLCSCFCFTFAKLFWCEFLTRRGDSTWCVCVCRVAAHSDLNQMSSSNLGIVFGPTLLRPLWVLLAMSVSASFSFVALVWPLWLTGCREPIICLPFHLCVCVCVCVCACICVFKLCSKRPRLLRGGAINVKLPLFLRPPLKSGENGLNRWIFFGNWYEVSLFSFLRVCPVR